MDGQTSSQYRSGAASGIGVHPFSLCSSHGYHQLGVRRIIAKEATAEETESQDQQQNLIC